MQTVTNNVPQPISMFNSIMGFIPIGDRDQFNNLVSLLPDFFVDSLSTTMSPNNSSEPTKARIMSNTECESQSEPSLNLEVDSFFVSCHDPRSELERIMEQPVKSLDDTCSKVLKYEDCTDCHFSELDRDICDSVLESIKQDETGRYIVPLIWEKSNAHLLPNNLLLCKKI